MPTADSFNALGIGNGFPFNPDKRDVSGFDKWQTLGGFKNTDSGSPSQAKLDLSLTNAMKLYWNLNGNVVSAVSSENSSSLTARAGSSGTSVVALSPQELPKDRVIGMNRFASPLIYNLKYNDVENLNSGTTDVNAEVDIDIEIERLYDGATTDEDNFVGYGASVIDVTARITTGGGVLASTSVVISSYLNGTAGTGVAFDYFNVPYGSGVNIPMVARASAIGAVSGSPTVSLSPPTASFSGTGFSSTCTYLSLDFYTYS